ncbi:hypothetical protein NE237_026403 [Protea cynaroides]|uniref:Ubiquitin-like domain-containing protein n=1 Tax=Protea cynaroides TaxID=273540 RepID=A0A9Q0H868_9MAGN|nr:hypothetical protein NE237_026403 [Protea cynaroides]
MKSQDQMQVFVQSPDLGVPSRALIVSPNHTLRHLKLSFLPPTIPLQILSSLFFTCNGKPLDDSATVFDSRILPFSNLILRIKVLGGGGDGGATGAESRDCYLNMYAVKKPDKVDPNEARLSRWTNCGLSFEPLKHPCVVDRLGNLFNKEPLVEALLGKKLPKEFRHIKGLKDMIPIELSAIPGVKYDDISFETRFQCPITGLEFNGKYKFFALRSCGHVLSAKAMKEVKSSACLVCHKEFSESDKIVINGSPEEVVALRERIEEEKTNLREKKEKKMKNGEVNGSDSVCLEPSRLSGSKHGVDDQTVEKASAKIEGNRKIANGGVVAAKGANNGSVKRFKAADRAPPNATKEHNLVSSVKESDEATAKLWKLKDALDELKQNNINKEVKIEELEKEKASLLERMEREVVELKKSKSASEIRNRELEEKLSLMEAMEIDNRNQGSKREEEAKAKTSEKDGKILQLQKAIKGLESKVVEDSSALQKLKNEKDEIEKHKYYLEKAMEHSQEKLMEIEAKANRLESELESSEKSVGNFKEQNDNYTAMATDLDAADAEKDSKGMRLQWQMAVACTGIVAATATLLYLSFARQR